VEIGLSKNSFFNKKCTVNFIVARFYCFSTTEKYYFYFKKTFEKLNFVKTKLTLIWKSKQTIYNVSIDLYN